MSSKIEFTIYLDEARTSIAFQAIVADKKKYDILYDPNKLYEHLLEDIIEGRYKVDYIEYMENQSGDIVPVLNTDGFPHYKTFSIDGTDTIENVKKFIEFQTTFGEYICNINEQPEIYPIFGIHLDGHEFGYGAGMMSPDTIAKAIMSVQKISSSAINNKDYNTYLREEAASYEIHIDATKRDPAVIELFTNVYDSIENKTLTTQKYQNHAFRTILNEFGKLLASHKKLSKFSVFIDGVEKDITNKEYIKEFLENPYSDDVVSYRGTLKSPDYDKKTFQLKTTDDSIWHCHFENGCESFFSTIIEHQNIGKTLIVRAYQKYAATLIVSRVTVES